MKRFLTISLVLPLAACAVEREVTSTTIVASVTPEQQAACAGAAARARGLAKRDVQVLDATATATGPVVLLNAGGTPATCKLDELGSVEDITFE